MNKRVVITGQGAISALGSNVEENCNSLEKGFCGITELKIPNIERLSIKVGAYISNYDEKNFFTKQEVSYYDRYTQFALLAAKEALDCSGLLICEKISDKVGVVLGNSGGGLHTQDENFRNVYEFQKNRVHPFVVPKLMNSAAASHLSIKFKAKGPSFTVSTACASSNHAMGQAFKLIQTGLLTAAFTGGSESMLCFGGIKAWEGLRVMSPNVCRPFSANRNGMIQGEGAAIFIFEEYEHARKRGANILAEVVGFAMSSDASDIVKPNLDGAKRTISNAIKDANISPNDVDYINAHGTGTLLNDKVECKAINQVFKENIKKLLVSSTKSMHGHLIGGSGAIELIACIMALEKNIIPPTINFDKTDPECEVNVVPNFSIKKEVKYVMSNSFAFGGMNAVLVLKKF